MKPEAVYGRQPSTQAPRAGPAPPRFSPRAALVSRRNSLPHRLHILRLTTANITRTPSGANLALSTHPIELPAELAALLERLAQHAEQSPRARTLAGDTHYLFPSTRRPNAPLHPTALGRRLARIGVRPRIDRNTAMATLAADLPAAVIAAQFGLTSQAATTWAQHSRRDSLEYLAARSEPSSGGTTVERSCSRSL